VLIYKECNFYKVFLQEKTKKKIWKKARKGSKSYICLIPTVLVEMDFFKKLHLFNTNVSRRVKKLHLNLKCYMRIIINCISHAEIA